MKLMMVALYYDYGQGRRGLSYEYNNPYLCLKELFDDVRFFDYYSLFLAKGKAHMNAALLETIKSERPDLAIFPLYQDEFDPEAIEELKTHTTTLAYFFDDAWREAFAEAWAPRFCYFTTPRTSSLRRHLEKGHRNVIYPPFGLNHFICERKDLPKIYDVSFVGGSHPYRTWLVKQMKKANISVAVWGQAWPGGRMSQAEMVNVINQTKINLNMSNSVHWDIRYLFSSYNAIRNTLSSKKTKEQIKGRNFEICGCGGFQLTHYAEDLERHFRVGDELAIYQDVDGLIEKIRYYLRHDDEREAIAEAGHRRAQAEHTYAKRFSDIVNYIFGGGLTS